MIEIRYHVPSDLGDRPSQSEWVEDDEVEAYVAQLEANGATVEVLGEVSWQRQLAAAENPEF